jgi:acyl carrier protein
MRGPNSLKLSLFFSIKVTNRKPFTCNHLNRGQLKCAQFRGDVGGILTVLDRANGEVTERVAQLVRRVLERRAIARPVGCDDDLRASGLSSLDMVNLMLAVEAEFAIKIPERDMTPTNFRSIARIVALVDVCRQPTLTD